MITNPNPNYSQSNIQHILNHLFLTLELKTVWSIYCLEIKSIKDKKICSCQTKKQQQQRLIKNTILITAENDTLTAHNMLEFFAN